MSSNPFTSHPKEVGESYGHHLMQRVGLRLAHGRRAAAPCLVHAVFPFLFVNTGSRTMDKLHRRMTGRAQKADWERHPII